MFLEKCEEAGGETPVQPFRSEFEGGATSRGNESQQVQQIVKPGRRARRQGKAPRRPASAQACRQLAPERTRRRLETAVEAAEQHRHVPGGEADVERRLRRSGEGRQIEDGALQGDACLGGRRSHKVALGADKRRFEGVDQQRPSFGAEILGALRQGVQAQLGGELAQQEPHRRQGPLGVVTPADLAEATKEVVQRNGHLFGKRQVLVAAGGGSQAGGELGKMQAHRLLQAFGLGVFGQQIVVGEAEQLEKRQGAPMPGPLLRLHCRGAEALFAASDAKGFGQLVPAVVQVAEAEIGKVVLAQLTRGDVAGDGQELEFVHDEGQFVAKAIDIDLFDAVELDAFAALRRLTVFGLPEDDLRRCPTDEMAQSESSGARCPLLRVLLGPAGGKHQDPAGHQALAVDPEDQ